LVIAVNGKLEVIRIGLPILRLGVSAWTEREAAGALEERSSETEALNIGLLHAHKLSEDAASGPNINLRTIVLLQKNEFRRSVPPSHHMPR